MTDSVRLQILRKIKAAFEAVEPADPPDPPDPLDPPGSVAPSLDWPLKFSKVELGPLSDKDAKKRYTLGIVAGGEREKYTVPYVECFWRVMIEFRGTVNQGDADVPAVMAENLLTVIKRVIDLNRHWGNLAVDTKRVVNEIDLEAYGDKTVVGVQEIEIFYRTSHVDPRDPSPDP